MNDTHVERLKELAEEITPEKAKGNLEALEEMDKAGEPADAKIKMLLGSMLDWIKYGN